MIRIEIEYGFSLNLIYFVTKHIHPWGNLKPKLAILQCENKIVPRGLRNFGSYENIPRELSSRNNRFQSIQF